MKNLVLIISFLLVTGAIAIFGLVSVAGDIAVWVRVACGVYFTATMILLFVMLVSIPRMAKILKKKDG